MSQKAKRSLKSWLDFGRVLPPSPVKRDDGRLVQKSGGTLGSLCGLGYIKREGKSQQYTVTEAGLDWLFGIDRRV
jgi:hypothetical protein